MLPAAQLLIRFVRHFRCLGLWLSLSAVGLAQRTDLVQSALDTQIEQLVSSQGVQTQVEALDDAHRDRLAEYRTVLQQLERQRTYNAQMKRITESQGTEITRLESELASLQETQTEVLPLLLAMVDSLAALVEAGPPFQTEVRLQKVEKLRKLLDRGDVTLGTKYREVIASYQNELAYASSIDAYIGQHGERTVEFLRLGRVGLYYQSRDQHETGWWNPDSRRWERLDDTAARLEVAKGLRMARKEAAPDLLRLPFPAPRAE